MEQQQQRIVIVGGGFAGIACALRLARKRMTGIKIILISDKPHFEYHAALYRLVTGTSPLEVCIPLREIFSGTAVEIIEDRAIDIHREQRVIIGASGSKYHYDIAVLALGCETNYFGIPGLREYSFGMKSITEALRLKRQITRALLTCKIDFTNKAAQMCDAHFVVIGGGATGVELAGQLVSYARSIAQQYGIDPSLVSVDLIEGAPRVLPALPKEFSTLIEQRLRSLGVNIFVNRTIEAERCEELIVRDLRIKAGTVVWTAGVRANAAYTQWQLPVDARGKVMVDQYLRLHDDSAIFIAGDGAATPYSGWAQTALYDGKYIADIITATLTRRNIFRAYQPPAPIQIIPIGDGWAGVLIGKTCISGKVGWWIRRLFDLYVFWGFLPINKAWAAFRSGATICDTCTICSVEGEHSHAQEISTIPSVK